MTIAKRAALTVLLLTIACSAQVEFSHVVIVIQENRTTDNLFAACSIPGANLQIPPGAAVALAGGESPSHTHAGFLADVEGQYTNGATNYVRHSDIATYCQLAVEYSFSNSMYQTNQGPSLPAHLFLFAGTSQPVKRSPYFESELQEGGCILDRVGTFIAPDGEEDVRLSACINPQTLSELLESNGLTWRYYAADKRTSSDPMYLIAPTSIRSICVGPNSDKTACIGSDWLDNVTRFPTQVLTDIANGNLASVSWVTPAASYSDHPAANTGGGPAWVASIVDAIGASPYWKDTAIIVTWDDWGGFWDHEPPLANSTGFCESYCYGFRVPMLVISAYTPAGYVDNSTHDFGSILHFVESNFGLPSLGTADFYADDLQEYFSPSAAPRVFHPLPVTQQIDTTDQRAPDDD